MMMTYPYICTFGSRSNSSSKVFGAATSSLSRKRGTSTSSSSSTSRNVSSLAFTTTLSTQRIPIQRRSHLLEDSGSSTTSGTANTRRRQQQQQEKHSVSLSIFSINNCPNSSLRTTTTTTPTTTKRTMMMGSNSGNNDFDPTMSIKHINLSQMKELVEEYENKGRNESNIIIIDVRGYNEINATGKLSPNTLTLPLPDIGQKHAFAMDEDDFLEEFGFEKPKLDETIVFTCKAGIRSDYAAQIAAMEGPGYTNLFNYKGGAMEWFYYSS